MAQPRWLIRYARHLHENVVLISGTPSREQEQKTAGGGGRSTTVVFAFGQSF